MKRKGNSQPTVSTDLYLDDYCWEHVFKFIFNEDEDDNRYFFKSLSLVSNQFLSISNRFRFSLTVWNPTRPLLSRLFQRFTNLISLDLSYYYGDINDLLVQISSFPLKLTSLNISNQFTIPTRGLRVFSQNITTLTSLICSNSVSLHVDDLVLISVCFPFLQELDLSNARFFSNAVVFPMTTVFPNLRKVNLSNDIYMNNSSLLHLCKTSKFLQEVVMLQCPLLTHDGIASAIRERPTLKSLSISWSSMSNGIHDTISSHFIDSLLSLTDLTCLDLSYSCISDELLSSIAMAGLPLRKLVLQYCQKYSYAGISCLLSKCQYIQHLDLQSADFLSDQNVMELSLFFGHLVSINLSQCRMLTESTLFSLVRNSPILSEVKMEYTSIGKEDVLISNSFKEFSVSPPLKSLHLANSFRLRDESIKMFASIFPNLELLGLSGCDNISGEGICQVLRRCCKIRDLNLDGCSRVELHEMNFELPKLKVLNLSSTSVDDETLYVISKRCSGLLQLILESCDDVTKEELSMW